MGNVSRVMMHACRVWKYTTKLDTFVPAIPTIYMVKKYDHSNSATSEEIKACRQRSEYSTNKISPSSPSRKCAIINMKQEKSTHSRLLLQANQSVVAVTADTTHSLDMFYTSNHIKTHIISRLFQVFSSLADSFGFMCPRFVICISKITKGKQNL